MKQRRNNMGRGIILILIGVLFAGKLLSLNLFFDGWWTMFLIVPSAIRFFSERGERLHGLFGMIVGFLMFLMAQDFIDWHLFFPLLLSMVCIFIGVRKLPSSQARRNRANTVHRAPVDSFSDSPSTCNAFVTGKEIVYRHEVFEGASLNAALGAITLDLRDAIFYRDTTLHVNAVMGGVEIFLPENVRIVADHGEMVSVFGAFENKHRVNAESGVLTIYLNGLCLMGGIEIH